jgi:hypothetical protein
MALTVDVDIYRTYEACLPEDHARWRAWIAEVMGEDPGKAFVVEVTLGEGTLTVTRIEQPIHADPRAPDELATRTEVLPAPTPPPCWPT